MIPQRCHKYNTQKKFIKTRLVHCRRFRVMNHPMEYDEPSCATTTMQSPIKCMTETKHPWVGGLVISGSGRIKDRTNNRVYTHTTGQTSRAARAQRWTNHMTTRPQETGAQRERQQKRQKPGWPSGHVIITTKGPSAIAFSVYATDTQKAQTNARAICIINTRAGVRKKCVQHKCNESRSTCASFVGIKLKCFGVVVLFANGICGLYYIIYNAHMFISCRMYAKCVRIQLHFNICGPQGHAYIMIV